MANTSNSEQTNATKPNSFVVEKVHLFTNLNSSEQYVDLTFISADTATPVQLPVNAQGQLFIVGSTGAGANATVNLPNASATAWVFRRITICIKQYNRLLFRLFIFEKTIRKPKFNSFHKG